MILGIRDARPSWGGLCAGCLVCVSLWQTGTGGGHAVALMEHPADCASLHDTSCTKSYLCMLQAVLDLLHLSAHGAEAIIRLPHHIHCLPHVFACVPAVHAIAIDTGEFLRS